MTLQNLLSELEPMRHLHPLTPCNVEAVDFNGCSVQLAQCDAGLEEELAEAREEVDSLEKQLKASEEENAELTRQLEKTESELESDAWDLKQAKESAETFRKAASDWAVEVQAMRDEVTALRKKKGVPVGLIAQQRDIIELLNRIAGHSEEKFHANCAKEILSKIYSH